MTWGPITLAGQDFSSANFDGTAYANETTGFPAALQKIVEHVAQALSGTSTTSLAVGTGAKAFTTQANKPFAIGMPVTVARTSAPTTTYMQGQVTAWNPATGAITVDVATTKGSGTHSDWTVSVGGIVLNTVSPSPLAVADGGTGASTAATARANLGIALPLALTDGGTGATTASGARTALGLGTAAVENTGTAAGNVVKLDGSARLPAVDGSQLTNLPGGPIPAGTKMLFAQAAAPSGWTQDTTWNDRVLRVVNSTGAGTGGSWTISGLSTGSDGGSNESHTHAVYKKTVAVADVTMSHPESVTVVQDVASAPGSGYSAVNTTAQGGVTGHTHAVSADGSWRPSYLNVIVCTKN